MKRDFARDVLFLFFGLLMLLCVRASCGAAPPDPVFRMESPSGCSGGWFHASRQYGLWGATCKHCVATPKRAVRVRLFKDGHKSPTVNGFCYAASRGHDASVIWIPPQNYKFELPATFRLSPDGPQRGATVFAVGSFAGGTVHPAARKVSVTSFSSGGYQFYLNDSAWGGHSGGAVVSERGELVGVLWGAGRGYSSVTSSRAIWETLYGERRRTQAMFSVEDKVKPVAESTTPVSAPTVKVYATASELARSGFMAALNSDPQMQAIQWRFENPQRASSRSRPMFEWNDGRTDWQIDGWPGLARLSARFNAANSATWSVQYCPNCPPSYGRGGKYGGVYGGIGGGKNPLSPWTVVPPPPGGGSGNADASREMEERLRKLEEDGRKAARDHEESLRKLRNTHDDELRKIRRTHEDEVDGLRRGDVRAAPSLNTARSDDTLANAIDQYRNRRKALKEQDASLKAAATDIDRVTADEPKDANKDWMLPGAIFAGLALIGGGVYLKK